MFPILIFSDTNMYKERIINLFEPDVSIPSDLWFTDQPIRTNRPIAKSKSAVLKYHSCLVTMIQWVSACTCIKE